MSERNDAPEWLEELVADGVPVPVSERRAAVFAGDEGIVAVPAPELPESPTTILGPDMEWYELEVPHYLLRPRSDGRGLAVQRSVRRQAACMRTAATNQVQGRFETLRRFATRLAE